MFTPESLEHYNQTAASKDSREHFAKYYGLDLDQAPEDVRRFLENSYQFGATTAYMMEIHRLMTPKEDVKENLTTDTDKID